MMSNAWRKLAHGTAFPAASTWCPPITAALSWPLAPQLQAAKVAPNDADVRRKLSECEREVKRMRFEEALATPVGAGVGRRGAGWRGVGVPGFWGRASAWLE